jgi:outer membrane lipase/esterase
MWRSLVRAVVRMGVVAAVAVLAACGGSEVIPSNYKPSRIIVFGDGLSDNGSFGNRVRLSVNDGAAINWTEQVATRYGLTLTHVVSGGTNYARAHARIDTKPDVIGRTATLTVREQIDAFLASDRFGANDLVLIGGGTSDMVAEALIDGNSARAQAAMDGHARALATQVRRIISAGGQRIALTGLYDISSAPYWREDVRKGDYSRLAAVFNERLLVSLFELGSFVLFTDVRGVIDALVTTPSLASLTNVQAAACNSVDAGVGIGLGTGRVNSALCTASTTVSTDFAKYLWADGLYLNSAAHRYFGDVSYDRIAARF